jgi:hypothetical protein
VSLAGIIRAEAADGEAAITLAHNSAVQRALEKAGVEFTAKADDEIGLRWSNGQSHADRARARAH